MSGRAVVVALTLATVVALGVSWSVSRPGASAHRATRDADVAALQHATASPPAIDPRTLRDVFRFADEAVAPARAEATPGPEARSAPDAGPVSGPRLVGLVSRSGRILVALAVGEDVFLLGPGETAAGITVLSLDGEAVRVRRSDGTEQNLTPP